MGTTCVSVYPYQLGHDNDEAIESGAFWFYRKLGFRPDEPICKNWRNAKKAESPPIRSIGLRRVLCDGWRRARLYETPGSELGRGTVQYAQHWLGVNRRMAREFGGDAGRMRDHSRQELEQTLGASTSSWKPREKAAFENFAFVLTGVRGLRTWTRDEKEDLIRIIRAKTKPDEMLYLHLTQRHERLRRHC